MVSPNLNKKSENVLVLTKNCKKLFQVVYAEQNKDKDIKDSSLKIKVSDLISKMSFYYEKIRNSVDYKEEYLLRKNAIIRILKRLIIIEGVIKISNSNKLANNLLIELIRAGYLANDSVPVAKIDEVEKVIEKYIKLRSFVLAKLKPVSKIKNGDIMEAKSDLNEKNSLTFWIISLAASEIEEYLGMDKIQETVAGNIYNTLSGMIELPEELKEHRKDLDIQIYLGVYRNFLKFDRDMLSFILFKYYNSNWSKFDNIEIEKLSQNIVILRTEIERQLNHPIKKQLSRIISKYTVFSTILAEVIIEDPVGVYDSVKNNPKSFPRIIKKVCDKKYKTIKSRLWRASMRSIIYIFATKSVFVFLLEIPAIKLFGEEVSPVSLAINITFPAFLLFLVVLFTRVPTMANTDKIITGIEELSFESKVREDPFVLRKYIKPTGFINAMFGFLYFITFFISFGLVIWILDKINFNWVSIVIFLFFLAFVSFFSTRIRNSVKEFIVIEPKDNIISFITDFFYVPIIAVGKWLSEKFSQINVFVFILDFIIEAPFKILVDIAEDWTKYVKERKENIL